MRAVADGVSHDAEAAFVFGSGLRHVVGVAGHAIASDFGENGCAAVLRVFEFFEHENPGAFAHDESIAILIPGTAGFFRIVIARGKRAHGGESADAHGGDGRLGAACDHHVSVVVLDDAKRVSDGMSAGGAGCGRGFIRALGSETHGDLAGRKIDDGRGNKERGNLARTALHQCRVFALDDVESADAGTDVYAHALGIFRRDLQTRHFERFIRRGQGQMDEASHFLDFFFFR